MRVLMGNALDHGAAADPTRPDGRRTRARRSRGAALVEMALVAPILAAMLMATIEAGWYLHTYLVGEDMSSEAARVVSIHGRDDDGDARMLEAVEEGVGGIDLDRVDRIVVFRASSAQDEPPAECYTAAPFGIDGVCSVFDGTSFALDDDALGCGYCPAERQYGGFTGVAVRVTHRSLTGLLGDRTLDHVTVLRLEWPE